MIAGKMSAVKNKVLLIGSIIHAQKEWTSLNNVAELLELTSKNRSEFLSDLRGKYSDITAIYSTFQGSGATGRFDKELAENCPDTLKMICHNGAGYDLIDVPEFTKRNIQVSHTPSAVDNATADTNMYLIIGALRSFGKGAIELRKGNWVSTTAEANDPQGKVLGILGLGGIGRAVRDRAFAFGFSKVLYYNRTQLSPELEGEAEYVPFDELLKQSDVLSLNLPLNPNTRHIINKEALDKCKDGVTIVNTARGAVIDEQALVDGLKSGKVKSVGLDVFENEPKIHPDLLANEDVLLLPHMGTHSVETRKLMEVTVIDNIRSGIETGKVINLVPEQKGKF